jgi:hypothetical protein
MGMNPMVRASSMLLIQALFHALLPFFLKVAVHAKQSEDYKAPDKPKNAFEGAPR